MKLVKAWFWSPKPEQENWAQTLVRVSGNLLRISITVIVAALVSAFAYFGWVELTRPEYESSARPMEQVTVVVSHRSRFGKNGNCSEQYPLVVQITNRSALALTSTRINLEAREAGRSTNLLDYLDRALRWDAIILPQHYYVLCYSNKLAAQRSDLVWSGTLVRWETNFSSVEDWMRDETLSRPIWEKAPN